MSRNLRKNIAQTTHLVLVMLVTLCATSPLLADDPVTAIKGGDFKPSLGAGLSVTF